jgi:ADP-ribosylglycohydrolase
MIGAIAGDIIGSIYEWNNIKHKDFELLSEHSFFTDDSILSIALAEAILSDKNYAELLKQYYVRYPNAGYGGMYRRWATTEQAEPYNSWGNGAAMRISAVGYAFDTLQDVLNAATKYTEITHNHPEGVKGAQATASCIYYARKGADKPFIKRLIETEFGYDLSRTLDEIRPDYKFNESCQETVPEAIIAFLESTGFEDAIRNAISLGGDSDTLACITGGIAQAFYGIPDHIADFVMSKLDGELKVVTQEFHMRYC